MGLHKSMLGYCECFICCEVEKLRRSEIWGGMWMACGALF